MKFDNFGVAADPIILNKNKILLMKRNKEPFLGKWEFPGGFMEKGEMIEETCTREAKEETGLDVEPIEILGVYTDPNRDPRGQTIGIAFICRPKNLEVKISDEASDAKWFTIEETENLEKGFDHGKMIEDLKKWMKSNGTFWSGK